MGCSHSNVVDGGGAINTFEDIDRLSRKDKENDRKEVKLLIIGAAESGKSTIAKQMKILHQDGFSKEERLSFKPVVYTNVVQSMVAIVKAMKTLDIPFENPEREEDANKVRVFGQTFDEVDITSDIGEALKQLWKDGGVQSCVDITSDIGEALKQLWKDGGVQSCVARSREYQLIDSAAYYLNDLDRLCQPDYIPTEQDVLRTSVKTTEITETISQYKEFNFTIIEGGGLRHERKKWIHRLQDVTAIIFCAALSAYDQVLIEDPDTNRMEESLKLFHSICNNPFFAKASMILFLNKKDLFEEKIKTSSLSKYFEEYQGKNTYDDASEYIKEKFEECNESNKKEIYTQFTCATDTENFQVVFDVVSDIIFKDRDTVFGSEYVISGMNRFQIEPDTNTLPALQNTNPWGQGWINH